MKTQMKTRKIKINKKGFINLVEVITVLIIIFVAFSIFFPGFVYKNRWNEAYITLTGRDTILTIDRLERLYNYSFSGNDLQRFLDTALPVSTTNLIAWSEVDGAVKNTFVIDCNCTDDQRTTLSQWFSGLTFNGRTLNVLIPKTNLESIGQPADVLLIWDYQDLSQYQQNINNFIKQESGVVEIMDFNSVNKVNNDITQTQIFGLHANSIDTAAQTSDVFVRNASNTSDIFYGTYKFFYHLPIPLKTFPNTTLTVPSEIAVTGCPNFAQGNISFNKTSYKFWDCSSSVYFDSNGNGLADKQVLVGNDFILGSYNFHLNYINGLNQIGVSVRPTYVFSDFGNFGTNQIANIQPGDNDPNKIIMSSKSENYPVVILNRTSVSRTAWIADFSENGYGDDEKLLLTSLLMWASNKRNVGVLSPEIRLGFLTSYINTANQDIFEVYTFNLGLGFPFGR